MSVSTQPTPSTQIDDLIEIRELVAVFRRRFWTLLAAGFLTFVAVVIFTLQATPLYTANASVVLNVRQSQVVDIEAVLSGMPPDSAMVDTEVEVLRSRALAETVVDALDLTRVPEFNEALTERSGLVSGLTSFLKALLPSHESAQLTLDEQTLREREAVVDALLEARSARRAGLTYVIEISATSETSGLARDIANAYAEAYLTSQLEAKFEATERANEWLNGRVETLRAEVQAREAAVASFRDENGLIDAEGATIAEQQVADLNSQLAIQRAERSEARARLNTVRNQLQRGVASDTIAEVLTSEVIRELRRQQAEVARRQADLSGRYGPRHPEIVTVQRELADINLQIEAEIGRIVASLENEVNISDQRVRSLQNSLLEARGELSENNSAIVQLRALEREAEASRALFESFLNRFRQTNESEGLAEADARIVAQASTPQSPSSPNVMLNLALGLVLAGIVGVGLIFALELFDNGVHTDADIEKEFALAHISSIPRLKPGLADRLAGKIVDPGQFILDKPMSGFAESFRTIRSAIRISAIDTTNTVIAISSALPGDGKTTTALCLGRVSAMAGTRTLVVDCDIRRRLLTKALQPETAKGLLEVLSGDAQVDDVIVHDKATGLELLPVAETTFTPRDLFGSSAFETLIETLRSRYDQVIIDTPPVMAVADTRQIASRADGVLMAVRWKKSPVGIVRKALTELRASKANLLGVVLNNVDLKAQARYGYDASGYYYRSYRNYYTE